MPGVRPHEERESEGMWDFRKAEREEREGKERGGEDDDGGGGGGNGDDEQQFCCFIFFVKFVEKKKGEERLFWGSVRGHGGEEGCVDLMLIAPLFFVYLFLYNCILAP